MAVTVDQGLMTEDATPTSSVGATETTEKATKTSVENNATDDANEKKEEQEVDDSILIQQAEAEASEERLLNAARLLKQVKDTAKLTPKHYELMRWAESVDTNMRILLEPPDSETSGWTKQSESHGDRNFYVYYQVDSETNQLSCRIESAIEASLLVPLVSVMNESDLYQSWMPSWERPFKLGVQETKMLQEYGRGNQIIQVKVAMPLFFSTREAVFHAVAVDVIEEAGAIAIQVNSESPEDDPIIPPPQKKVVRMDFENSMLIRGCPSDHMCYPKKVPKNANGEEEEMFLLGTRLTVDAKVSGVPISMINFATRTVIGTMFAQLLKIASAVRDGKMEDHQKAIAEKAELYDWIDQRLRVMIQKVKEESNSTSKV